MFSNYFEYTYASQVQLFLWMNMIIHGALKHKEMNKRIAPTVKVVWNVAMHVLHFFWGGGACHKHNHLPLVRYCRHLLLLKTSIVSPITWQAKTRLPGAFFVKNELFCIKFRGKKDHIPFNAMDKFWVIPISKRSIVKIFSDEILKQIWLRKLALPYLKHVGLIKIKNKIVN